jgi:hypothetical protein
VTFPLTEEATHELRELLTALEAHDGDWYWARGGELDAGGVMSFPYTEEHPLVARTRRFLDEHRLTIVFDWARWEEGREFFRAERPEKYREVDAEFVLKLLTALIRNNRFNDGAWALAFASGDVPRLLGRLLELQEAAQQES